MIPGVPSAAPIPYPDEAHQRAAQWLTEEAYLLDRQLYRQWLERMTPDVRYRMPVRVTNS